MLCMRMLMLSSYSHNTMKNVMRINSYFEHNTHIPVAGQGIAQTQLGALFIFGHRWYIQAILIMLLFSL